MAPQPHHRSTDSDDDMHQHERGWTGPTEHQWLDLCSQVKATHDMVTTLDKAFFGEKEDGVEGTGGVIQEVRTQKELRLSARSTARWALGVAIGTAIAVAVEWVLSKFKG